MSVCAGLIVVTGLPGSGKTTLARALAERYAMPLIAKDTIKEPLLDVLGAASPAESRRLSDASFAALFAVARELLSLRSGVILEGNFRCGEHEAPLLRMREERQVPVAQVLCWISETVRLERLRARQHDRQRHPGHRDADQAVPAEPARFLEIPGERFTIQGSGSGTQAVLQALDRWIAVTHGL